MPRTSKDHYAYILATLLAFVVGGCGLQQFIEQDSEQQRLFEKKTKAFQDRLEEKGKAFRAKNDMPSGKQVTDDDLEEIETEIYRIPIDAVESLQAARGKSLKREIIAGQIICSHDLIIHLSRGTGQTTAPRVEESSGTGSGKGLGSKE